MVATRSVGTFKYRASRSYHLAFVGVGVRDVQVIRLRACCGDAGSEFILQTALAPSHGIEVVADADDLDSLREHLLEVCHDDRGTLDGRRFTIDPRSRRIRDIPIDWTKNPYVERMRAQRLDDLGYGIGWQRSDRRRTGRGRTMIPPLKAAIAMVSSRGSTNMRKPNGGRPLVMQKRAPRSRKRLMASIVRCVSTFSLVISVPSTSANNAAMGCSVRGESGLTTGRIGLRAVLGAGSVPKLYASGFP